MADNIYRDHDERNRRRGSHSIFSDESSGGRWREDRDRGYGRGRDDDRGFLEKAGEEIRSWFGDEDDRGERERSSRDRDDHSGRYDSNRSYGRDGDRDSGGVQSWGQANDLDEDRGRRTGSRQDDHYRTWRERQMAELDRDYEDYCRERQQQFDSDFSTWRSQREQSRAGSESGRTGTGSMSGTGESGSSRSRSATGETSGETGTVKSGTAGTGDDSSVKSSAAATQGRSTSRSRS